MLELLTGAKKAMASARERDAAISAERAATQSARDAIANAPTSRADLLSAAAAWVDATALSWAKDMDGLLLARYRQRVAPGGPVRADLFSLVNPGSPYDQGQAPTARELNGLLCAMFRPQVIEALERVIDRGDSWPAAGLPQAQRDKKLAELDAKLAALSAEQSQLREQAAEIGLNLY